MSESIKLNGKFLDAEGVYDHTQEKTQSEINEFTIRPIDTSNIIFRSTVHGYNYHATGPCWVRVYRNEFTLTLMVFNENEEPVQIDDRIVYQLNTDLQFTQNKFFIFPLVKGQHIIGQYDELVVFGTL